MKVSFAERSRDGLVSIGDMADAAIRRSRRDPATVHDLNVPWRLSKPDTPLHTLWWRARAVALVGRQAEQERLLEWALSPEPFLARRLCGPAGSGKSRLAAEFASVLIGRGWSAGFVTLNQAYALRSSATGTLFIVDDPTAADGDAWAPIVNGWFAIEGDTRPLRVLVLAREPVDAGMLPGSCSIDQLGPLTMGAASALHQHARRWYAPERPAPLTGSFTDWAAIEPDTRLLPLYTLACALSLGYPPWSEEYPSTARLTLVTLVRAATASLESSGVRAGLGHGVASLVAALSCGCESIGETQLRSLASHGALTEWDADAFMNSVRRFPLWRERTRSVDAFVDGLPAGELVNHVLAQAIDSGMGPRVGAALGAVLPTSLSTMSRRLGDGRSAAVLLDRLAGHVSLSDPRWLHLLNDEQLGRGSFLARLARITTPYSHEWRTPNERAGGGTSQRGRSAAATCGSPR